MPPVYAVVITHTTRHLRRTLLGLAVQRARPAMTVVTCDNDAAEIGAFCGAGSGEFGLDVGVVQRAHAGEPRMSQVRNNGVRALAALGAPEGSRVLFLDGDCFAPSGLVEAHGAEHVSNSLVVGYRVELTEAQTEAFDEDAARRGGAPTRLTEDQIGALQARDRRYRRHLLLRRLGLGKAHKPKVLSAHASAPLAALIAVNGFDEEFTGWGGEDDDLGRRLYRFGVRPALLGTEFFVYHLWHPTRAPGRWDEAPGVARFKQRLPVRCERGLDSARGQATPELRVFSSGREVLRRPLSPGHIEAGAT